MCPSLWVFISFVHMVMCFLFCVWVCGSVLCLWSLASHGCISLTRTKLAGNHPSSSSIWPHHQSLLEASSTLMTSPALNANSRSAMVTWSHTASALTIEPPLINWRNRRGKTAAIARALSSLYELTAVETPMKHHRHRPKNVDHIIKKKKPNKSNLKVIVI